MYTEYKSYPGQINSKVFQGELVNAIIPEYRQEKEKGNQKVKQGQRIVSMEWRRNIEDRDRLECIHIHWPTWGPHKGHPPPTPYPPTDKSAIPPAWLEHELSPLS